MNATQFFDAIKNTQQLKSISEKEIKSIVETHPYFSNAQLLQFGNDYFMNTHNLQKVAIYKSDPLLFANFIHSVEKIALNNESKITKDDSPKVEIEEIINSHSEIQNEEENISKKYEVENPVKKSIYDIKEEILNDEKPNEDIISLINELPNTPIFEPKKEEEITSNENKALDNEEPANTLMVMMSFTDWLNHFKKKTQEEKEEETAKKALKTAWQKEKLTAIIEEETDEIPELIFKQAMDSITTDNILISESLAELLAKQGKTDKAIDMYKKLSLQNPEKNTYFANRIKDLLTNNI